MIAVLSQRRCTICKDHMQIAYLYPDKKTVILVCGRCDRA